MVYFVIWLLFKIFNLYSFNLNYSDSMLLSLIERWGMFIFKIIYSYVTKNYERKKLKYYEKYKSEFSSNTLKELGITKKINTE